MKFSDRLPYPSMFALLGDDITYHAVTGDVAIKAIVSADIDPVFSGGAQLQEMRTRLDVIASTVPGIKKGSKFTINGVKAVLDAIVSDNGDILTLVVR